MNSFDLDNTQFMRFTVDINLCITVNGRSETECRTALAACLDGLSDGAELDDMQAQPGYDARVYGAADDAATAEITITGTGVKREH